jgi:hypothetical protein
VGVSSTAVENFGRFSTGCGENFSDRPHTTISLTTDTEGRRRLGIVKRYGDLLKTPGVAQIIAAQLTARFPKGMISLAYLLHIEQIFDSYGAAGLVLAATSAGQAIAGPLTSR